MTKTIVQKVVFKNTTSKAVYDLYMNAKKHAQVIGGPAEISPKVGSNYSVHGGYIKGQNLHLEKNKLIVQSWRASDWNNKDADSVFSISLEQKGKDVILHAIHSNLPEKHAASIDKGWHDYYWSPWKQHLAGKTIKRKQM